MSKQELFGSTLSRWVLEHGAPASCPGDIRVTYSNSEAAHWEDDDDLAAPMRLSAIPQ